MSHTGKWARCAQILKTCDFLVKDGSCGRDNSINCFWGFMFPFLVTVSFSVELADPKDE